MQTAPNISQLLRSASAFLHFFFLFALFSSGPPANIFSLHRKHALTNFFDLSNIRFVSRGSSEMLRTSRCIRNRLLQSAGTRTLAIVAPFLHSLSIVSQEHFVLFEQMHISSWRERSSRDLVAASAGRFSNFGFRARRLSNNRPATIKGERAAAFSAANLF
jgi:hypothetical protein